MKKPKAKIFIITFISIFFVIQNIFAQQADLTGLPLIRNYPPSEHGGTPQNWGVVQDKKGIMYFANTAGVLEYDGVSWRLIEVENDVARTIAIDDEGTIFVGGIDQFGYLQSNQQGKLEYHSLISLLPEDSRKFGDIWSVWSAAEGVFFQSASHLFLIKDPVQSLLEKNTGALKYWKSKSIYNPAYLVDNNFYMLEAGIGLLTLIGDSLKLTKGGERFANSTIYSMLTYSKTNENKTGNKKILIGAQNGFYIYDGITVSAFKTEADDYIIKNQLYFRGAILSDNTYAFGTQNGGLVVIDAYGNLKKIINKFSGLNDNTIWFVYSGKAGALWLATNNGITKINYPSSLTILDSHYGLDGVIYAISEHSGKIYVTTTNGIYYSSASGNLNLNSTFRKVEGVNSESWEILDLVDYQLIATTNGVYKLDNTKSTQIKSDWRFAYSLYQSKSDKNLIYVGLHHGIATLRFRNGEWIDGGKIPGVTEIILSIVEDADGTVWLSTYNKGLIKLVPFKTNNQSSYSIMRYGEEKGIKEKQIVSIKVKNKIFFATKNKFVSYDERQDSFVPDDELGERFISNYHTMDAKEDVNGNIWVMGGKNNEFEIGKIIFDKNRKVSWEAYPILNNILENELTFAQYHIYPDKFSPDIIWITAIEKLYKFNIKDSFLAPIQAEYFALIRRVKTARDSVIYYGNELQFIPSKTDREFELEAGQSSVEFSFASTNYINEIANRYQYYLEGFDPGWSEWIKETRKEYTNLPSGDYKFYVRAKNALGQISGSAVYNFRVLPPWFKRWWANVIGFIIVLSMIYYVIRYRVKYLEKRNIVLERMVNERTTKINEQNKTLEDQANKLKEMDQIKSNFFANISHEFRTPLTLIKGQIESLLEKPQEQKAKKKLNMALANSNHLHKLINQVLDLTKLESGTINLEVEKTEIVSFIRNRVSAFESLAEQRKIELKNESKVISQMILIDKEKMEEVIDNLLSNAFKFTNEGGRITVTTDSEEMQSQKNILITVEDNGIGIPEEKLLKIFSRFFQVDSSSTKEQEGTGLGLAIVKEIIDLHAGSINVESKVNEGTKFSIRLPLEELSSQDFEESEDSTSAEVDTNKDLILIVEDNIDVRGYIKENLQDHYNIVEAGNGEEGIDKAIKIIPDLIISDLMMPKVDGFQLCEKLKNDQRTSHIPIIMLTARADEKSKLEGLKIGADEYLSKPFSAKELELRVGNLIRIRQLLREKYREISILNPDEIIASSLDKEFVEKVFYIIKNHLEDNQFSVQLLADEIGMSVSQLNRKLNALIDQTAGKLIRSTKLEYAAKLIKSKSGNISEIADKVGFSDITAFGKSFKSKYGVSPSDYQKNLGN